MTIGAKPTSLRKACHNCTVAKRRCVIKFPYCDRCSKKGLECRYDLKPLTASTSTVHRPMRRPLRESDDVAIHCLLNKWPSHNHSGFLDELLGPDVREGIEFVRSTLRIIPSQVYGYRPSVFIHPKLHHTEKNNSLSRAIVSVRDIADIHPSHEGFQVLVQSGSRNASLESILVEVQAIMLYMLAFLFGSNPEAQISALPYFDHLSHRVKQLERQACSFHVKGLTQWQAWLLGESTRRTLLSSHVLTCVFFRQKYKAPEAKLQMEALPFDDRGGLWLAETPQAWAAAAGAKRAAEVKTILVSWHEFGCKSPSICMDKDGDLFLAMMLVCHNGKRSLER